MKSSDIALVQLEELSWGQSAMGICTFWYMDLMQVVFRSMVN